MSSRNGASVEMVRLPREPSNLPRSERKPSRRLNRTLTTSTRITTTRRRRVLRKHEKRPRNLLPTERTLFLAAPAGTASPSWWMSVERAPRAVLLDLARSDSESCW